MRINRVYTRVGDDGATALIGGDRVSKASPRIEAYGTVDELNAALGLVGAAIHSSPECRELGAIVLRIQNELFNLGCQLATPDAERRTSVPALAERHVEALEGEIDKLNAELPALESFVLPGGGWVSSYCHLARTICRRAERIAVALAAEEEVEPLCLRYLNRLSDALFVFGRWAAAQGGEAEPLWRPSET